MSIFSHHTRHSSASYKSASWQAGFTITEMLVVMGIMTLLTTTFLVRQNRFNSSTVLRSLAYSVALSVRQAQVYGVSVVGTTTSAGNCSGDNYSNGICYAAAYGVNFDWGGGSPTSYVLFADLNNSGAYDTGEAVKTFSLGNGYVISNICATNTGGTPFCSTTDGLTYLNVIFRRPDPDACFSTNLAASTCLPKALQTYVSGYVQLQALNDPTNTRNITVTTTGLVSVCAITGC